MPTKSFLDEAAFISSYNNYQTYLGYLQSWAASVNALAAQLQADPNYASALSSDEQTAVATAATASSALMKAVPVVVNPGPSPVGPAPV